MTLKLNGNEMASTLGISQKSVRTCKMRLKKKLQPHHFESVENHLKHLHS